MNFRIAATVALAAAVHNVLADVPAPTELQGTWTGTYDQAFALAAANDPQSFECLPGGATSSRPIGYTVTANVINRTALPLKTLQAGVATFTSPAEPPKAWFWADYRADGILMLRDYNNTAILECYYAQTTGTGTSRTLTIVALGGTPYVEDWELQCDPASYTAIPNVLTVPYCESPAGDRTAYKSTTLTRITWAGPPGTPVDDDNGASASTTPQPSATTVASSAQGLVASALAAVGSVAAGAFVMLS